jgi:chain length determinant protein EpsF
MNLAHLSLILKARARTVALVTVLTIVGAGAASLLLPKTYKATTSLILNYKGADHVSGGGTPAQASTGYFSTYVATQMDIIKSPTLAERVVRRLRLASDPAYREKYDAEPESVRRRASLTDWIADKLSGKVEVKPSRDSSVLNVSFSAADPVQAATTANAFADEYRNLSVELDANPAMQASRYLDGQLAEARKAMETSLSAMARFQEETGIIAPDNAADLETGRLTEISTQLVGVQAQLMEAQSKSRQAANGAAAQAPDIANNPLIQSLKSDLSRARMRLSAVNERVTPDHPNAITAQAEVNAINEELARQTALLKAALAANTSILLRREAELRDALAKQRQKVLELNQKRTTLTLLSKEVDNRKRIYDALSQRLAQASIQGRAHQSDVAVLAPATAPALPSNPRKLVILAAAGLAGLLVGACAALIQELLDKRVRSTEELLELTQTPLIIELGRVGSRELAAPPPVALLPGPSIARGH